MAARMAMLSIAVAFQPIGAIRVCGVAAGARFEFVALHEAPPRRFIGPFAAARRDDGYRAR